MTDTQRKIFNEKLEEFFELIKKELNGETIENTETIDLWYKNVADRYRNLKTGTNPRHHLPQEHIETLKRIFEEKGLTLSDFEQSNGKRKELIEIMKNKTPKEYSIEELKQIRDELDIKINELKQKQSKKYKQIYHPTVEEIKKTEEELKQKQQYRKEINEQISAKEEPKTQEKSQRNTHGNYSERVQSLIQKTKDQEIEIIELEEKIEKYEQEKQNLNKDFQEKYEKRTKAKEAQLENDYKEKIKIETQKIESKYKTEIYREKQELEEYRTKSKLELDNLEKKITRQATEINENQKKEIVELLCTKDNITLDDIKQQLEHKKIPTERFIKTLKELKNEIPGIVRSISEDGIEHSYSIKIDAIKQLEEYKKQIISPRISNIQDGTVKFIVRSDLHLNMRNSEETIKEKLFPCIDYSAKNNNIPIIDLGDLADTLRGIKIENWKNFDKDAIKQAYKFYRNYAKAIASAPEIGHYTLFGNHDEHPYNAGIDPLEIILENSNNFRLLGISSGSFKVGNDKIGVYHDKQWQSIISAVTHKKNKRNEYIYDFLCEEAENFAKDYIYSLIGHYHFGKHNPELSFSVIGNGIGSSLLFTAEVKDGHVEKMYVTELYLISNTQYKKSNYQTEIYNRGNQYSK